MTRLLLLIAIVAAAGCSGTPPLNPQVSEAQAALLSAEADAVDQDAPVAFEEARDAVLKAEAGRVAGGDMETVTHLGYLALQRVRIAEQTARFNRAGRDVEAARAERQQVQLEARTAEAEAAQRRAEVARREAEAARLEAETARTQAERERAEAEAARRSAEASLRRAQELADQVSDLQARLTNRGLVLTLGDVLFDTAEATLKEGGARAVDRLVTFLTDYPQRRVLIEGFTDEVGSDESNLRLSQRRADAVRQALLGLGIAEDRVRTRGYGEAFPVATNSTAAGRQQNRRVEIVISDENGQIPDRTE